MDLGDRQIVILGDTHMDLRSITRVMQPCPRATLIQLGDFGYFPGCSQGTNCSQYEKFITNLNNLLTENSTNLYFLRGNHENHEDLAAKNGGKITGSELVQIESNVFWMPDGFRFTWNGFVFLVMGGAVSVDQARRTAGFDWWPSEKIGVESYGFLMNQVLNQVEPVDVLLTHEAPRLDLRHLCGGESLVISEALERECIAQREAVQAVMERFRPQVLIHGHYHNRASCFSGITRVEGLGCNCDAVKDHVLHGKLLRSWLERNRGAIPFLK